MPRGERAYPHLPINEYTLAARTPYERWTNRRLPFLPHTGAFTVVVNHTPILNTPPFRWHVVIIHLGHGYTAQTVAIVYNKI